MDPSGWSVATLGSKSGVWLPVLLIFRTDDLRVIGTVG
jgi:hypothetical protein